jgi:hypothetical protein
VVFTSSEGASWDLLTHMRVMRRGKWIRLNRNSFRDELLSAFS